MDIEDYIVATDSQLVRLAAEGDHRAFEYLFMRYNEAIKHLFDQRLGDTDTSNDLLQETFIKVYLHLADYSPNYTFGQWIYTIARNTFIDYVRRRRDSLSIDSLTSTPSLAPTTDEEPDKRIISEQHSVQIERCMAALPEKYRQMAEMRFVRELSYEEIASQMGLPIGTVKTQIFRARERLCKLITENEN